MFDWIPHSAHGKRPHCATLHQTMYLRESDVAEVYLSRSNHSYIECRFIFFEMRGNFSLYSIEFQCSCSFLFALNTGGYK